MKASGYTTDTSPFHIQSEGVKGFRFLFLQTAMKGELCIFAISAAETD